MLTLQRRNSSFDAGFYGGQQTERGKELWIYTKQNFAKIAEDIGALGIRVEKPAEIGPALLRRLTDRRKAV